MPRFPLDETNGLLSCSISRRVIARRCRSPNCMLPTIRFQGLRQELCALVGMQPETDLTRQVAMIIVNLR